MPDGIAYNKITAEWLAEQGFTVTPDDKLGLEENREKPDFLCKKDDLEFWVEVKKISLPERIEFQGWCFGEFKSREARVKTPGRGLVKVAENTSEKDIKVALSMADKVLSGEVLSPVKDAQHYVVIPKDPVEGYNEFVQIQYETNKGEEVLHSVKSISGKYSRMYLGNDISMGY